MSLKKELRSIDPERVAEIIEGLYGRVANQDISDEELFGKDDSREAGYPALMAMVDGIEDIDHREAEIEGEDEEDHETYMEGVRVAMATLIELAEVLELEQLVEVTQPTIID